MSIAYSISAIADGASSFYRRRAFLPEIADTARMEHETWRHRLNAALKARNISMRQASIRAGAGDGYVQSVLVGGKDPTIDKLRAVCDAVPVSLAYILFGHDITAEDEAIVASLHAGPEVRDAVLTIIRMRPSS